MTEKNNNKTAACYLAAFTLPAALFSFILILNHITPFGNTTLLFSDLDSQYVEFMAEYRRILSGDGNIFWSWHAGLGMNFLALTAYYLASPFNFLLLLFPENRLPLAITVLTVLKIGFSGAAYAHYLLNHFRKTNPLIPVFAACYALSAYSLGYFFNIMWLDALIWLPLLCSGIDQLIEPGEKGTAKTAVLFALSFLSQFYMAWMTGAFCVLYFLAESMIKKHPFRLFFKNMVRFGICAGTAASLSAFLLLPTFFVLKNNMGLIGQEFPSVKANFPFPHVFSKLFAAGFDGIKDCLPHIYCGLPALTGLCLYFFSKEIPARTKIVRFSVGAILLFSFWFAPFDFLWHAMDHPSWFPYRYAFLFCFWILTLAFEGSCREFRNKDLLYAVLIQSVFLLYASFTTNSPKLRFVSLNGAFLVLYTAAFLFLEGKPRNASFTLLVLSELIINGCLIISGYSGGFTKETDYQAFRSHYQNLIEGKQPADPDFYRMEKTNQRNYNDPLGLGFPGISHFSSTASTRQTRFLKQLGFNCYATWCDYQGSTSASDAMLRIRYEFSDKGKQDSTTAGNETWEHPALFPLFFFAEESFARYDFFTETDAVTRQNDLLKLLDNNSEKDYFEEIPVTITHTENLSRAEKNAYRKTDPEKPAWIEAEIVPREGRSLYLLLPEASLNYSVTINGKDQLMNGYRDYAPFPICLDAYAGSGTIGVRVDILKEPFEGGILAFTLDTERLLELSQMINRNAPIIIKNSQTSFTIKTDPSDKDRLIVTSIPFDAGWQLNAADQKLPLKMIHESVLGFTVPAGCDTIEVSYLPYGLKEGAALNGAALIFLIILMLYERRKHPFRARHTEPDPINHSADTRTGTLPGSALHSEDKQKKRI